MILKEVKHFIRAYISLHPVFFYSIIQLKKTSRELMVNSNTELVIEGFPRSANTFAVLAFQHAQQKPVVLAHHLHAAAQVIRGVEMGIPVLILLRDPKDAISSLLVRYPYSGIKRCINEYINFYKSIYKYRNKFVVTDFEEITSNYGSAIRRLNNRFDTKFDLFINDNESTKAVFKEVDKVHEHFKEGKNQIARPTEEKNSMKNGVRSQIESVQYQKMFDTAYEWHNKFANEIEGVGKRSLANARLVDGRF